MKKFTKIMVVALAAMTMLSSGAIASSAVEIDDTAASTYAVKPSDDPQADDIIKIWRVENGVRQYRRWNKSKLCWVDPDWITP